MLLRHLLLHTLPWVSCIAVALNTNDTIVDLGYASYEGVHNSLGNAIYYLGIRYAAPPIGELRFQAPKSALKQPGIQQANTEPQQCYQSTSGLSVTVAYTKRQASVDIQVPPVINISQSEDCLFLNVWTPAGVVPSSKLPVLVWIHGGGYVSGSMAEFNGWEILNNGGHELVVVEIQYRLGIFGFLAGKEMKEKGALNAGILDQDFALQWIQKYIHLFGGDPTKVTIWGESAGAGSVLQHLVAHGGRDDRHLFRAAITSSVFLPFQYPYDHRIVEEFYTAVVDLSGCGNSSDAFHCLRTANVSILEEANIHASAAAFFGTYIPVPVIDGDFIIERPVETLNKGLANGEKLYAVNNALEGSLFVNQTVANGTLDDYVKNLAPTLNSSQISSVVSTYSNITGLNTTFEQAIAVIGEAILICPSYFMFNAFPGKAYRGWFDIFPASHGEDLYFYFLDAPLVGPHPYNNTQLITSFAQSFTSFAKSLDVNNHKDPNNITPNWNVWSENHTEMLFSATNITYAALPVVHPFSTDPALLGRCEIWNDLAPFLEY